MARLLAKLSVLPLAGLSLLASAEEAAKAPASNPAIVHASSTPSLITGSAGAQLMQLLLGLVLVVGLIFLLAWLVRRVQQVVPRGNQAIRLISSQALGPRDRLVLVQVGEEQVLLGLTPGRITPLHVLRQPVHAAESEPAQPEFAQRLLELLNKDKGRPQ
ncbi:flagellar biosynthetic protein FliO [Pseudomonas nicosulfuronedens]|uniref:Flagellar protein n=1 Tax=Pseudomonas nicosulfuronedens TaxID=2571105 RepID=A0A5R9RAR6_9PSED|nr:flagellar biosynthetic protein FliO [Pseudomonas nicosulfuronedens]MDH1010586.1 flagellar biosynthetic protein FliO [Pseudomonas nicosulfuronedens]MDH1979680.1 flagellar biosynthetic protein FliO [Pseudomonas nicosulfuronedens]MDH2028115.1 flagellar biosynthetic protein FliO [Pseudomonas nicosulfuronedens]TLX80264.1 flagellar biosynthetic protein FliO [Pseudomonas nicosulfuronedens]